MYYFHTESKSEAEVINFCQLKKKYSIIINYFWKEPKKPFQIQILMLKTFPNCMLFGGTVPPNGFFHEKMVSFWA
jgi:hypothetical protein